MVGELAAAALPREPQHYGPVQRVLRGLREPQVQVLVAVAVVVALFQVVVVVVESDRFVVFEDEALVAAGVGASCVDEVVEYDPVEVWFGYGQPVRSRMHLQFDTNVLLLTLYFKATKQWIINFRLE